ncbi:MAG: hypothetical protein GX456_11120 [Verrucomicrobia bacterium]|nr:hypothetical protein [Verrucomicrobiota bacterium]
MLVSRPPKGGTLTVVGVASPDAQDNRSPLESRVYAETTTLPLTAPARQGRRALLLMKCSVRQGGWSAPTTNNLPVPISACARLAPRLQGPPIGTRDNLRAMP